MSPEEKKQYDKKWYLSAKGTKYRQSAKFKKGHRIAKQKWRSKNLDKVKQANQRAYYRSSENPTGESQWLRKNLVELRIVRRLLRSPRAAWKSLKKEYEQAFNIIA